MARELVVALENADRDEAAGNAAMRKAERRTGEGTADAKREAERQQGAAKKAREVALGKLKTCVYAQMLNL